MAADALALLAYDLLIAWRNVIRHARRSAVVLGAVAFGVAAFILASGFVDWILWATRETTIHSQFGHLQVARKGYLEGGAADPFGFLIAENAPERQALEGLAGVRVVAPRLAFAGLVSHGDATVSFLGEGVAPGKEAAMNRADRLSRSAVNIVRGSDLSADDPEGIVMGEGLAANLGISVGARVALLSNTRSGGINAVEVQVRGIFNTISKAYDDSALRVPRATAHALLRVSGDHRLVVLLDSTESTAEGLAAARKALAPWEVDVTPWYELADFYNKTAALFARQTAVVSVIIAIIIALSISNALLMNVAERTSEIGTALALGARKRRIRRQFVIEGTLLGALGGLLGAGAGVLGAALISRVGIPMPPPPGQSWGYSAEMLVTGATVAQSIALALAAAFVASAYPAWKASKLPLATALRANR